jgi:hypothetical protein
LPMFPELSSAEVAMIAEEVKETVAARAIERLEAETGSVLVTS